MKKAVVLIGLLILLTLESGCADFKSFMKDRGNDLVDCFTARAGLSYGLGVRVQATSLISISAGGAYDKKKVGYYGRTAIEGKGSWVVSP